MELISRFCHAIAGFVVRFAILLFATFFPLRSHSADVIPESEIGKGKPYFDATTTAKFLTSEWDTIKANIAAKKRPGLSG
jgi:hypothetical protein